jgi:hypothetical protein
MRSANGGYAGVKRVGDALKTHGVDGKVVIIRDGAEVSRYFGESDLDARSPAAGHFWKKPAQPLDPGTDVMNGGGPA